MMWETRFLPAMAATNGESKNNTVTYNPRRTADCVLLLVLLLFLSCMLLMFVVVLIAVLLIVVNCLLSLVVLCSICSKSGRIACTKKACGTFVCDRMYYVH